MAEMQTEKEWGAIVCGPVFRNEADVFLVVHDRDGWWQFLCGRSGCNDEKDAKFMGVMHLVERDPTLKKTFDLLPGRFVERERKGREWVEGVKVEEADGAGDQS